MKQWRALELIDARLDGELSVAEIARHCGLSPSRFRVAFRNTTGVMPHRWLTERRVDRAKSLLRQGSTSLAQIALECGFADQSHFTHVFTAIVGASPGEWQRSESCRQSDRSADAGSTRDARVAGTKLATAETARITKAAAP